MFSQVSVSHSVHVYLVQVGGARYTRGGGHTRGGAGIPEGRDGYTRGVAIPEGGAGMPEGSCTSGGWGGYSLPTPLDLGYQPGTDN